MEIILGLGPSFNRGVNFVKECINDYFVKNNEILKNEFFVQDMVSEGKSIYEVIRVIEGKPLFLEEHLKRLVNSCTLENKDILMSEEQIEKGIKELIKWNNVQNGNIKLVFNYKESSNTYLVYFIKHSYPEAKLYEIGVDTTLFFGERTNPNAKVINSSFREQVEKVIKEKQVFEAILVDNQGFITEGSKSNIFMVEKGIVVTSPLNNVLPGITRSVVIDIVKSLGIGFEEKSINYKEIEGLEGLFITGTSPKVLPIKTVDNFFFNSSENKIIVKIMKEYEKACSKSITLDVSKV
jgi:branched-chain amino acid aminotransferase